ncbi:MAG TPA: RdgB/HAM1 family non-canonical purine NTP pyrophosphatase [Pseudacidobacterium sp.]|nr:RdgB/HAM1 family non-canonical purine NTP pyrophosphatase [Pseudacidobacterium sp.]
MSRQDQRSGLWADRSCWLHHAELGACTLYWMSLNLYVATSNPGKLRDFAAAAEAFDVAVIPLPNLKNIPVPAEDGATFEDNARIKALYYSTFAPEELVIADDSGLEVDALGGKPGVRSARYADDAEFLINSDVDTDERNNLYLLQQLASHPAEHHRARYRCAIAAARAGKILLTTEGSVEGEIISQPRGTGGFGYDPLFYLPELGKTMSEIDIAQKQTLSHRGKAFLKLLVEIRRKTL